MVLIKLIFGICGMIGGKVGNNLILIDIVECMVVFGYWFK